MSNEKAAFRLALSVAIGGALMLAWLSLGVGIIGADGDRANAMYFGVIAIGLIAALIARGRPLGMARALLAMALAQTTVALIAVIGGLGRPYSGALELTLLNGFFVALFIGSARLFCRAALTNASAVST